MARRIWQATTAMALLAACTNQAPSEQMTATAADAVMPIASPAPPAPVGRLMAKTEAAMSEQSATAPAIADRKVIRTADLRIQLDDVVRGTRLADSIVALTGGEVAHSSLSQGDRGEMESQLTIRVPATRFEQAMTSLRQLGRVRVDNSGSEDVTRVYSDLEIRLAVKRETITRLRSLLATKAARLADIIQVERELDRAIVELEQMEGQRRYLDAQVAMSTINLSMYHAPVAGPGSFLDPILIAIRQSVAVLGRSVAAIISMATFLIPWVVIGFIAWIVGRRVVRRRAGPAASA